ncbi:MAG: ribosome recycling factor [Gammaproteobacteria bacterium]|nr:ribosome recycling factor [Gammaproteobacteria bacterium]
MLNEVIKSAEGSMQKAIESLKNDLGKLRTGRAHPSIVEGVKVDYYGTETLLKHVANITVSDAKTITITPWEKNLVKTIEKAIASANLGLNPVSDANLVRVPLPPLTEERRKEMAKVVKATAENFRVAVRTARHQALEDLKELLKEKEITEDDERRAKDTVQKLTDKYVAEIDKIAVAKESELMSI